MHIQTISFKRTAHSKLEYGIIVNDGVGIIVDEKGKQVDTCWNWWTITSILSATIVFPKSEKL